MAADSANGSINGSPRAVFAVNRRERDIDVCGRTLEIIGGVREVDRSVADADLVNVPAQSFEVFFSSAGRADFSLASLASCLT